MALAGHAADKNVQPSMPPLWPGEAKRQHLYNSACNMTILVGYDYWMVIVGCKNARLILDKAGVFFIALELATIAKWMTGEKGLTQSARARMRFCSK